MNVMVTGHHGYIGFGPGRRVGPAGHEVTGLDRFSVEGCDFGRGGRDPCGRFARICAMSSVAGDLPGLRCGHSPGRVVERSLGSLDESCTLDINHLGSVRLAKMAKSAGVARFLFASSCSCAGVGARDTLLDERAAFNPITACGRSKVFVERDVAMLADDEFSPTFFRNATAYGVSPRLRADVVVNNLVGLAYATGEVLVESDGTPWRPLVHIEDISRRTSSRPRRLATSCTTRRSTSGAPRRTTRSKTWPTSCSPSCRGVRSACAEAAAPDPRSYRVNCDKHRGPHP